MGALQGARSHRNALGRLARRPKIERCYVTLITISTVLPPTDYYHKSLIKSLKDRPYTFPRGALQGAQKSSGNLCDTQSGQFLAEADTLIDTRSNPIM